MWLVKNSFFSPLWFIKRICYCLEIWSLVFEKLHFWGEQANGAIFDELEGKHSAKQKVSLRVPLQPSLIGEKFLHNCKMLNLMVQSESPNNLLRAHHLRIWVRFQIFQTLIKHTKFQFRFSILNPPLTWPKS